MVKIQRLTSLLEKMLYHRSVLPIIVKTSKYEDIKKEVEALLPAALKNFFMQLLPRVTGAAERALVTPKLIRLLKMLSFPATSLIIEELAQDKRVEKIYLDRTMYATEKIPDIGIYEDLTTQKKFTTTYWTRKLLGLDKANTEGWTGKGVTSAIIDTGVAVFHEQIPHVERRTVMPGLYSDGCGHGTFITTVLGGKPAQDTAFRVWVSGMAPETKILNIKALGYIIGTGKESDVLEAMELAVKLGANIINLSLGSEQVPENPEDDPQVEAIKKFTEEYKVTFVCAAGNSGPEPKTINSPGVAKEAITVGALNELTGETAEFSSRGPTPWGDIKPDVVAPGVNVDSGCVNFLDLQGDKKPQRYSYLNGSSVATPHVSGLLACAREFFKSKGIVLDTNLIKQICSEYGLEEKSNINGYGLIQWDWFERYIKEHS